MTNYELLNKTSEFISNYHKIFTRPKLRAGSGSASSDSFGRVDPCLKDKSQKGASKKIKPTNWFHVHVLDAGAEGRPPVQPSPTIMGSPSKWKMGMNKKSLPLLGFLSAVVGVVRPRESS